jgi:hypothetical protein
MFAVAPPTEKAPLFYAFGAFCLSTAVACLAPGRIAQFFGSVVAASVLVMGISYFGAMVSGGPAATGRRSDQSFVNAVMFLVVFGVPSAVYLWRVRFGFACTPSAKEKTTAGGRDGET